MRDALRYVENGVRSVKAAAIGYDIPRTTSRRYVMKVKDKRDEIDWKSPILEGASRLQQNYTVNKISSPDEKDFQTTANLHHGLNPKYARKLAYDLALAKRFRSTRIFPFNPTIFNDDDFIASTVTDLQKINEDCLYDVSLKDTTNNNTVVIIVNNNDAMIDKPSTNTRDENIISNRKMQVLPKKKSEILTNTPVLGNLEEEEKLQEARKSSLNKNSSVKKAIRRYLETL
ncbi:hypothetical protein HHI36_011980 [Cryptolaemus montrouzieri]|uniref:HTH psq-type domain-containing protein n=1 Tax=Cryptolaemus montrouzieri TaxID=559131 RepID=A0ABD2NDA3_9CUCU